MGRCEKFLIIPFFLALCMGPYTQEIMAETKEALTLPSPRTEGTVCVESALQQRRSTRSFANTPLTLAEIGQILWAAQGITSPQNRRTAPSAGALYPLEIYLLAGNVNDLSPGIYHYSPQTHTLKLIAPGEVRSELTTASRNQKWIRAAPAIVVIAAVPARTAARYGSRANRYVAMEVGAAVQNIQLQGISLKIGSTFVGAFDDNSLKKLLKLAADEQPMAIVPLGHLSFSDSLPAPR